MSSGSYRKVREQKSLSGSHHPFSKTTTISTTRPWIVPEPNTTHQNSMTPFSSSWESSVRR